MARTLKVPFLPVKIEVSKIPEKGRVINRNYDKVFVIGFNKTGTTTLKIVLARFGLKMGNQPVAQMLIEDYIKGEYERIIRYCHTADAFQDQPFSSPELYKILDREFPNSKFILTVRETEDAYNSLVKFHAKRTGSNGVATEEALDNDLYIYKGFLLDVQKKLSGYPQVPLYDKESYKEKYLRHINDVRTYFKDRPNNLLEINVANKTDFGKLCEFLNVETKMKDFPWRNKTKK